MRPLVLALLLPAPALADTFVLVPGAFAGAWAWDGVAERLRAAGHDVVQVEPTGQGARVGENGPGVTAQDHVGDVLEAIEGAEPPVILVAHSHGGRPAAGAWGRARDRVAAAVFVEAPAPFADTGFPADGRSLATVVTLYPEAADSGMMPPPPVRTGTYPRELTPMSLRALYGEVPVEGRLPAGVMVVGDASSLPGLRALGERLAERDGWEVVVLQGGHDLPMEAPDAVAEVLLEVAAGVD